MSARRIFAPASASPADLAAHAALKTGVHGIPALSAGEVPVWNGSGWTATNVATQAELDALSTAAAAADSAEATARAAADAAHAALTDAHGAVTKALTANANAVTSEATNFTDLTGLGVDISASATERWALKFWLLISAANATHDMKFAFTVPAGLTGFWGPIAGAAAAGSSVGWGAQSTGTAAPNLLTAITNQLSFGTAAGTLGVPLIAIVKGGGNAGTLQLKYCQAVSDPGSLQALAGSWVEIRKLAA